MLTPTLLEKVDKEQEKPLRHAKEAFGPSSYSRVFPILPKP